MQKHRLLNILRDLNIKLAHSDIEAHVMFKQFDDGELGICFTHFSDYYEKGYASMYIFNHNTVVEALETFNDIKLVITGERLVTDERSDHIHH
ncbi:hypothetical protein QI298_09985 [Staphylococcus saprophyticus]|uniref:hypothetical protein n=1 Tax=Staphylococcus saprophyticus TaxID=29385 RepID=UPI0022EB6C14|nr:hypothetical protein [Staphylococcus saprophyticus]MDW3983156.1 hypothetical protein [Staphylococcus saprophyticus]